GDELLCVLFCILAIVRLAEVSLLCVGNGIAGGNCGQLVLADTARKYLVLTCCGVELPLAWRILRQRNWKGKIVRPGVEHLAAYFDLAPAMHLVISGHKVLQGHFVLYRVSRKEDGLGIGTEDREQCRLIARLCRFHEGGPGVGRRREGFLDGFVSCGFLWLAT